MSLPDYQTVMLPLLRYASEASKPVGILEMLPYVARDFHLTEEQLAERLPSGVQGVFHNRLHWAKFYMTRAGLLESTKRGRFQITNAGRELLSRRPERIDNSVLARYPQFLAFKEKGRLEGQAYTTPVAAADAPSSTPEELLDGARRELEANLKAELLERVRQMPPSEFENLIIQLLLRMGYGEGREEMARAIGGSGDGGLMAL